ncbi:MAG TPA: methyltransferase domain-containing protein [Longimicrobium sp.]|jgi:ubiquinone/menaquinone biosynthesis C-methylase UbiE
MSNRIAARVRREYEGEAARYDRRWAAYLRGSMELLRPWLEEEPPRTLLDVGCGTAALLRFLRAWRVEPERYAGLDPSLGMLRRAAGRTGGVVAGAAEALPFRDGTFDTVVSASAFHYWSDPGAGLAEVRRVLAPGGRVLMVDWSRDFLGMRVMDAWLRLTGHALVRTYAEREARALMRGAGLRVVRAGRRKIGPVWGLWAAEARGD